MFDKIKDAVESIFNLDASKIEGEGWKVYAVGSDVIRVDIKSKQIAELFQSEQTL